VKEENERGADANDDYDEEDEEEVEDNHVHTSFPPSFPLSLFLNFQFFTPTHPLPPSLPPFLPPLSSR